MKKHNLNHRKEEVRELILQLITDYTQTTVDVTRQVTGEKDKVDREYFQLVLEVLNELALENIVQKLTGPKGGFYWRKK